MYLFSARRFNSASLERDPRERSMARWRRSALAGVAVLGAIAGGAVVGSQSALAVVGDLVNTNTEFQFGENNVGNTSGPTGHIIVNNGPDTMTLTFTGGAATLPFHFESSDCDGATLAPGAFCQYSYTFQPTSPGTFSGTANFTISTTTDPATSQVFPITLHGTATVPLTAAPTSHDFGELSVGETSDVLTTTFTNDSTHPYGPLNVSASASAPFEIVDDQCSGATVPQFGGTCTIGFRFAPIAAGPFNELIVVGISHVNASGRDQEFEIALSGVGIDPDGPATTTPPSSIPAPTTPGATTPPTSAPPTTAPAAPSGNLPSTR